MGRKLVIVAVIAFALGAPVAEMLDRWDTTPADGNDTEANVVIAALCIGAAFAIGTVVVTRVIQALRLTSCGCGTAEPATTLVFRLRVSPPPTTSPPTILRV